MIRKLVATSADVIGSSHTGATEGMAGALPPAPRDLVVVAGHR